MKLSIFIILIFLTIKSTCQEYDFLSKTMEKYNLPAVAYAVVKNDSTIASEYKGIRFIGTDKEITQNDKFHIGSCTKSMTATLIAILVQEGKLSWETKIGDIFTEIQINEQYKNVSITQLLSHTAGAPGSLPKYEQLWLNIATFEGTEKEVREYAVSEILKMPPENTPGTTYLYSNAGYIIAAAIIDKVMNRSYEEVLFEMLLHPLEIESAGFGPPGLNDTDDQPKGHNNNMEAVFLDNPVALNSAGRLHLSLPDFIKYINFHIKGYKQGHEILRKEYFEKLHTPVKDNYALGWFAVDRNWADGIALTHAGSNTFNYALMWLAPNKNIGFVVVTNVGIEKAFTACDEIAEELIKKYILQ